jgi:hypothetical protein
MARTIPQLDAPSLPLNYDDLLEGAQDGTSSVYLSVRNLADKILKEATKIWTYDSILNTTAGTSITLSNSIPSTALEIEVLLNGVSTSINSQPPIIRLGDAGGVENTGYIGVVRGPTGENAVTDGFYTFRTNAWNAGDILSGRFRLTRWDPSLYLWFADGLSQDQANISSFSGRKTTSEVLTTIILTTPGGTATFDLGSARVRYR